jgi:hypothetical protein
MNHYLQKGDIATAVIWREMLASVAGVQPKLVAERVTITGTVSHIRADDPTNPTSIGVALHDGTDEHWVNVESIVAVEGNE